MTLPPFRSDMESICGNAATAERFDYRRVWSRTKMESIRATFQRRPAMATLPELAVFCAGSFARDEASEYSDIDLFFIRNDDKASATYQEINVKTILIMAETISVIKEMDLPDPSNDGAYLKILKLSDIVSHLGSPKDDHENFFTARMLLLLESAPVSNDSVYNKIIDSIIDTYLRDYKDHVKDFRATFLVNDIIRFWKTLCLNYEHKRNQDAEAKKIKQKVRNLKLGHSRLLTCFATIALLSSYNTIDKDELSFIFNLTPTDRLRHLHTRAPEIKENLKNALRLYDNFLELSHKKSEDLENYLSHKDNRARAFANAKQFGDEIFAITQMSAAKAGTLRYLVV
jgi:predicted nucleotidyltransferase